MVIGGGGFFCVWSNLDIGVSEAVGAYLFASVRVLFFYGVGGGRMNVVCIIGARSGSKAVPNKNIRPLAAIELHSQFMHARPSAARLLNPRGPGSRD